MAAEIVRKEDYYGGELFVSGEVRGTKIKCIEPDESSSGQDDESMKDIFQKLEVLISQESEIGTKDTNPGLVVTTESFDISYYHRAVRGFFPLDEARHVFGSKRDIHFACFGNGRGLIGCLGALAWLRNRDERELDRTFEIIAYRAERHWGAPRIVDVERARTLENDIPHSFNNYDHVNGKALIYPGSPCPVLFGVRGERGRELLTALTLLNVEEMDRWQLFISNQGTDDHLFLKRIAEIENYDSVISEGSVTEGPWTIAGGHVFIRIAEDGHEILASAFEPTKSFRNIIRALRVGDHIRLFGGVKGNDKRMGMAGDTEGENAGQSLCINIEKIEILALVRERKKTANPRCSGCGSSMKSMGRKNGYRCRRCGTKAREEDAVFSFPKRALRQGEIYEVDGVARRHLSKPLKRMCS